jgi:hypothetical protein
MHNCANAYIVLVNDTALRVSTRTIWCYRIFKKIPHTGGGAMRIQMTDFVQHVIQLQFVPWRDVEEYAYQSIQLFYHLCFTYSHNNKIANKIIFVLQHILPQPCKPYN